MAQLENGQFAQIVDGINDWIRARLAQMASVVSPDLFDFNIRGILLGM